MLKCVICQKETTEKPHCPVNWKRYNSGAGYLYTFERDLKLNYEAGKVNLAIAWKCFYISKSFATVWHRLSRCVQQDCTGSHDEKKNDFRNPSMFLFERSLSGLKMIVHLPDAGENGHKSVMIRAFFSRSVFLNILDPATGLFRLEGILGVLWYSSLQRPLVSLSSMP